MGFSLLAGGESGFVSGFSSQRHIGMVLVLGAAATAGWLSGPLPLWPCYMAGGGGSWEILYEHTGFSANHRHVLLKFGWNYVEFLFTS